MTKFQINKLHEMMKNQGGIRLSGSVRQEIRNAGVQLGQTRRYNGEANLHTVYFIQEGSWVRAQEIVNERVVS